MLEGISFLCVDRCPASPQQRQPAQGGSVPVSIAHLALAAWLVYSVGFRALRVDGTHSFSHSQSGLMDSIQLLFPQLLCPVQYGSVHPCQTRGLR